MFWFSISSCVHFGKLCFFEGFFPFHLNCWIYWHKVIHNLRLSWFQQDPGWCSLFHPRYWSFAITVIRVSLVRGSSISLPFSISFLPLFFYFTDFWSCLYHSISTRLGFDSVSSFHLYDRTEIPRTVGPLFLSCEASQPNLCNFSTNRATCEWSSKATSRYFRRSFSSNA